MTAPKAGHGWVGSWLSLSLLAEACMVLAQVQNGRGAESSPRMPGNEAEGKPTLRRGKSRMGRVHKWKGWQHPSSDD